MLLYIGDADTEGEDNEEEKEEKEEEEVEEVVVEVKKGVMKVKGGNSSMPTTAVVEKTTPAASEKSSVGEPLSDETKRKRGRPRGSFIKKQLNSTPTATVTSDSKPPPSSGGLSIPSTTGSIGFITPLFSGEGGKEGIQNFNLDLSPSTSALLFENDPNLLMSFDMVAAAGNIFSVNNIFYILLKYLLPVINIFI